MTDRYLPTPGQEAQAAVTRLRDRVRQLEDDVAELRRIIAETSKAKS